VETPIIVAVITGAFGLVIAAVQSFRRENKEDHAVVLDSLRQIHREIHYVGTRVDDHLEWHSEGNIDGRAGPRDS
jgi:hypothetical protein